jgi:hypothetical protein
MAAVQFGRISGAATSRRADCAGRELAYRKGKRKKRISLFIRFFLSESRIGLLLDRFLEMKYTMIGWLE